ncbi:MAG TPA: hypothetical protein VK679_02245 [Gemmatimonadaceae bacterium]|nr:hypothetical protein [Gemmatimonadaceae bacterium]
MGALVIVSSRAQRRLAAARMAKDSTRIVTWYDANVARDPAAQQPPNWLRELDLKRAFAHDRPKVAVDTVRVARARVQSMIEADGDGTYIRSVLQYDNGTFMRWPAGRDPIRVWIQPPAPVAIQDAFRAWNAADAGVTYNIIDDSTQADVHVLWTTALPNPGQFGATDRQQDRFGRIMYVHIWLLSPADIKYQQNAAIYAAGYALGLASSPNPDDIMARTPSGWRYQLSDADVRTLRLLYQLPFSR